MKEIKKLIQSGRASSDIGRALKINLAAILGARRRILKYPELYNEDETPSLSVPEGIETKETQERFSSLEMQIETLFEIIKEIKNDIKDRKL
jgi:hypothetical protein